MAESSKKGLKLGASTVKSKRRELFCQALASGATHRKAYIDAGFAGSLDPAKAGQKMATMKWCKDGLEVLYQVKTRRTKHDSWLHKDFVLSTTKAHLDRCMQAVPVLDKKGQETGVWKYEATAVTNTLRMIGPEVGLFNPEKKSRHGQLDPLDNMNEKQLIQFIGHTLKDLGPGALKELGLVAVEPDKSGSAGDGEEASELDNSPAGPLQTVQ